MATRRITLAASALGSAAPALGVPPAAAQNFQAGDDHRAVRAGGHVGHPGAADRAKAVGGDRPAGDRRKQAELLGPISAALLALAAILLVILVLPTVRAKREEVFQE